MGSPYVGEIILTGFTFAPVGYAFCDGQLLPISQYETLFQLIGTTYGGDGQVTFALPDLRGRVAIGTGQGLGLTGYSLADSGGTETIIVTVPQMPPHTHAIDATGLTASARVRNALGNQLSPAGHVFAVDAPAPFTDPLLSAGSAIRAVHITELRSRINTYRVNVGLSPFSYTDPTLTAGSTPIRAVHILELRASLQQAYAQGGLTPPAFTDRALTSGTSARAVHITELRSAVNAVFGSPASYTDAAPASAMAAGAIVMSGGVTPATGGSQPHENRQPFLALNYCISLFGVFPSPT